MHRAAIVLPALLAFPLAACVVGGASGQTYVDAQRGSYAGFTRVNVSAGVEAVVSQGAFDVKGEIIQGANFDDLIVEVKGDTLYISRKPRMFGFGNGPRYRVKVSAPAYDEFDASSGAHVSAANLSLKDVSADVSSGAHMDVAGTCGALELDVSSGGHFDGENLHCATARVDASSGAHADAYATQMAEGDASSGASVTFHGQPAQVHKDTSSGGSVHSR